MIDLKNRIITSQNNTDAKIQPTKPNAHNCCDNIGEVLWNIDQDDQIISLYFATDYQNIPSSLTVYRDSHFEFPPGGF